MADSDADSGVDEVEEINQENIQKLAKQAAGGGGDEADEEDEGQQEPDLDDSPASAAPEVQIEKLKATIQMLKEQNNSTTDRLQTLSQNMGELRQMVHEQEVSLSDMEAEVSKVQDQIGRVEPQEIEHRMSELQSDIESNQADIKKLQDKLETVEQKANDAQETLNELGSLDNLIEINKDFEEKLNEIQEAERYIERLASKSEKINTRINKKMDEYNTYKAKVDALEEKSTDTLKKLDELELDVEDAVEQDQLEQLKERVNELESQVKEYNKIAPLAEMSLPQPIVELREEREQVREFLDDLEQRYEAGEISESEYQRIREANEKKLNEINQKLIEKWEDIEEATEEAGTGGQQQEEEEESGEEAEAEQQDEGADETADGEASEYDDLLGQSVADIKDEVQEKNYDIPALLEAERQGQNRSTLVDWLESKTGE